MSVHENIGGVRAATRVTGKCLKQVDTKIRELFGEKVPALNGYPHVVDHIERFWGFEEIKPYFEALVVHNRTEGMRQGFAPAAFFEIQKLIDLHNEQFPKISIGLSKGGFVCG